jgi:formylglycine-generating enzyme required for sulfatase activity
LAGLIKVNTGVVYASADSGNSEPFFSTSSAPTGHPYNGEYSQIDYNDGDGSFSVRTKEGRDMSSDPVVVVSWYGSAAYCNWRSGEEGYAACYDPNWDCNFAEHGYRLPTEAEWEYAGRGGEHSPYYRFPWGDTITHSQANYYSTISHSYDISPTRGYHPDWNDGNSPYTAPVGTFAANGYGLYDMIGNVWEWCNDWYSSSYYITSPSDNPQGPASGTNRVVRGGCWSRDARDSRVAWRFNLWLDNRSHYNGFRVVLDPN